MRGLEGAGSAIRAEQSHVRGDFRLRWRSRGFGGTEFFEQGREAERFEVRKKCCDVEAFEAAFLGIEIEIDVVLECDELAGDGEAIGVELEVFLQFWRELLDVLQNPLDVAGGGDELGSGFSPTPGIPCTLSTVSPIRVCTSMAWAGV